MTATTVTAPLPQIAQVQQRFSTQPGETIRMKGNLSWLEGDPGFKNLLSGKFRSTDCTVFLTNKRFVATKARRYYPWGPLVWLVRAMFKRRIVFSIPLGQLTAVKQDPECKTRLILHTADGAEFKLSCKALFCKAPKWVDAVTDAVSESVPGASGAGL